MLLPRPRSHSTWSQMSHDAVQFYTYNKYVKWKDFRKHNATTNRTSFSFLLDRKKESSRKQGENQGDGKKTNQIEPLN